MQTMAVGQFIRANAGLIALLFGVLLTALTSTFLYLHRRAKRRKQAQQALATCWLATLSELSTSINGMQAVAHRLVRNRQHPGPSGSAYKSDVLVHRWLSEGFMLMAVTAGHDCQTLVKSMQKELTLFDWNITQAANARLRGHGVILSNQINRDKLQKLVDVFDSAAIRLACNRHTSMVTMWKQSGALLNSYCRTNKLASGIDLESPGSIPLGWQMDESQPWMIKNLAPVGDETW